MSRTIGNRSFKGTPDRIEPEWILTLVDVDTNSPIQSEAIVTIDAIVEATDP